MTVRLSLFLTRGERPTWAGVLTDPLKQWSGYKLVKFSCDIYL